MKIITVPHPILNQKAKPVVKIDKKTQQLVKEMIVVLNKQVDPAGVGLAAPQVGINLSLFIIKPTAKSSVKAFINPRVIKHVTYNTKYERQNDVKKQGKTRRKTPLEGCLSIPKIWATVKRAKKILLEYQTLEGEKKTEWFSGLEAVIIQHEMDHLNGTLFTQRALEQQSTLFEEKEGKLVKKEI